MKKFGIILLTMLLLVWVNLDLFHYDFNLLCRRDFSSTLTEKGTYYVTEEIPLKPGKYELFLSGENHGTGSGYCITDGNDEILSSSDFSIDGELGIFPFEISGSTKNIRVGVRYDPNASAVKLERIRITGERVLYKDTLLRHAVISLIIIICAILFSLRMSGKFIPKHEKDFLFICALTLLSSIPLLLPNHYPHGDDLFFHLSRIEGIAESLKAGYFPVRDQLFWLQGYGYGCGFFYPDLFLYLPALLRICGFSLLICYEFFVILCTFFACLTAFIATKRLSGNLNGGRVAAVFTAFSAYRLLDVFYRAALGEIQALIFLPLIIWGLYEIFNGNPQRWPIFATGFFGLLGCHILSLEIAGGLTLLFCLLNVRKILREKGILGAFLKSVLTVCGISASFLLPFVEQSTTMDHLRINILLASEPHINVNYAIPFSHLFSNFFQWDPMRQWKAVYPGWALLIALLICLAYMAKSHLKEKFINILTFSGMLLLWLSTRAFPWKSLPHIIANIQFAWRILLFATAVFSVCGGICFARLFPHGKRSQIALFILGLGCFAFSAYPLLNETLSHRMHKREDFIMQNNRVSGAEYMPRELPAEFVDKNRDTVLSNSVMEITQHKRNRLSFTFTYSTDDPQICFSVPLIYYTGYRAEFIAEDGTHIPLEVTHDQRGLVSVCPGKTSGTIRAYYQKTVIQWIGEFISLSSLCVCVWQNKRRRTKASTA